MLGVKSTFRVVFHLVNSVLQFSIGLVLSMIYLFTFLNLLLEILNFFFMVCKGFIQHLKKYRSLLFFLVLLCGRILLPCIYCHHH